MLPITGKENVASSCKGDTAPAPHLSCPKGTTLLVPAAAWHALHMRVDDLQAQNATLAKEQAECTRYLKAFLKLEHHRRERAATRLQAAARGMLSRKRHPRRTRRSQSRPTPLRLSPSRLHASRQRRPADVEEEEATCERWPGALVCR